MRLITCNGLLVVIHRTEIVDQSVIAIYPILVRNFHRAVSNLFGTPLEGVIGRQGQVLSQVDIQTILDDHLVVLLAILVLAILQEGIHTITHGTCATIYKWIHIYCTTVRIVGRNKWHCVQCTYAEHFAYRLGTWVSIFRVEETEVDSIAQPRTDIDIHFGTGREVVPLICINSQHTLLVVVTSTHIVVDLVVTTCDRDVVVLHRTIFLVVVVVPVEVSIILVSTIRLCNCPWTLWIFGHLSISHP